MTIAGIGSSSMAMPSFEEMKAKRQEGLAKLKESNPELAQKVEKIDSRMEELRTSGVDPKKAMETIKSEVGELSESDRASMDEAFGTPAGAGGRMFAVKNQGMQKMGGGRPSGPPPSGPPPSGGPRGAGGPGGATAASGTEETSETEETDEEADALKEYLKQIMEKAVEEYKASSSATSTQESEDSLSLVA